jgi:integrase
MRARTPRRPICLTWCGFLLGTGCRIGEALALTWPHVDLERDLVHMEATLIRVKGQGLLMKREALAATLAHEGGR